MSALSTLSQLDTSTPEATKQSLARLVQTVDEELRRLDAVPKALTGTGSPLNRRNAPVGSLYLRTDGGASTTLYVKESGGNSSAGWVAK